MKYTKTTLLALAAALGLAEAAHADVTYDFTDKGSTFDNETIVSNILLSDAVSGFDTFMTVSSTSDDLNSNAGGIGVGDDQIDGTTESITLVFTSDIELNFVDLGSVGSDAADGANLTAGAFNIDLFTGVSDFNGTSDIYEPSSALTLSAGESIILTGSSSTSSFDLEAVNVSVVPEPSSFALIAGIFGLTSIVLRRRRA